MPLFRLSRLMSSQVIATVQQVSGVTFSHYIWKSLLWTDGKRGKISDVFEQDDEDGGSLQRTLSQPDFFYDGDEPRNLQPRGSLFARPGFGSVAFRCVRSA